MSWTDPLCCPALCSAGAALRRLRRRLGSVAEESGSAVVEFIGLSVMLLIPVVYLLVGAAGLQAASYAAVGAADQAAKVHAASAETTGASRQARSEAAVARALGDFGIDPVQAQVSMECPSGSCEQEGDVVLVTVAVQVPVPLVPQIGGWDPALATVRSTSAQVVSP